MNRCSSSSPWLRRRGGGVRPGAAPAAELEVDLHPALQPAQEREDAAERLERTHHQLLDHARRLLDLVDRVRQQQVDASGLKRREVGDLGGGAAHAREVLERRLDLAVEPSRELVDALRQPAGRRAPARSGSPPARARRVRSARERRPPRTPWRLHLLLLVAVGLPAGLDRRCEALAPLVERVALAVQVARRVLGRLAALLDRLLAGAATALVVSRSFSPSSSRVSRPERGAKSMASAAPESAPTMKESTMPAVPPLRSSLVMSHLRSIYARVQSRA